MENKKGTYWYLTHYYVCVLCSREDIHKSRVYNRPKPEEWDKRHIYHEEACSGHFV